MRLIDADALLKCKGCAYDSGGHLLFAVGTGDIVHAPTIDAIPVEWLQYMQQECLSENDRTMVGAIEAIFIEWYMYVNRLREMNRQKEQEDA